MNREHEPRTIGRDRITALLGEGGMGVVDRAEDSRLGRSVALKFLSSELPTHAGAKSRFEREARSVADVMPDGRLLLIKADDEAITSDDIVIVLNSQVGEAGQ